MNFREIASFKFLLVLIPLLTFFVPKISTIVNSYLSKNQYFKEKIKLTNSELQNNSNKTENSDSSDESYLEIENEEEKQKDFFSLVSKEFYEFIKLIPEKEIQKLSDFLDDQFQVLSKLNLEENKLVALANTIILSKFSDLGLFNVAVIDTIEKLINDSLKILNLEQKSKYSQENYEQLKARSEKFAGSGKKSASCLLENIISISDPDFVLEESPVSYDKQVFISIEDFKRIVDAKIEYMENNATIVAKIQSKTLEFEIGSQEVYLNDIKSILPAPILNIDGMAYLPCTIISLLGTNVINISTIPAAIFY
ncbi:MAG: copper amine oxidase N-terminal domain-containing protein [Oscillospiraceae bacterium]|jgi:hypothetical protein|nr:copper amine oxidase N-terminal domain-containing protein [Oscillospiraceae bacterium]